eukprot:UN29628
MLWSICQNTRNVEEIFQFEPGNKSTVGEGLTLCVGNLTNSVKTAVIGLKIGSFEYFKEKSKFDFKQDYKVFIIYVNPYCKYITDFIDKLQKLYPKSQIIGGLGKSNKNANMVVIDKPGRVSVDNFEMVVMAFSGNVLFNSQISKASLEISEKYEVVAVRDSPRYENFQIIQRVKNIKTGVKKNIQDIFDDVPEDFNSAWFLGIEEEDVGGYSLQDFKVTTIGMHGKFLDFHKKPIAEGRKIKLFGLDAESSKKISNYD